MDAVSHAALGAAASQPSARRRALVVAGIAGALAPDLDLLFRATGDPMLFFELHRQFTHSLVFAPVGALGVAVLVYAVLGRRAPLTPIWLFCLLGYVTHVLLDACTSYGVELLWPFSGQRATLSIVSVFDPLLTLPLAGLAAAALRRRRRGLALAGLGWAAAYLGFAAVQAERAQAAAAAVAERRGHEPARLIATPSFANTLVWKSVYAHDGRYYVDAIRVGLEPRLYPGASVPVLDVAEQLAWLEPGSRQARYLERFRAVSHGYLALDPDHEDRVIGLRYSLVPNRLAPYWALDLDPQAAPDAPAELVTTRDVTPRQGRRLLELVLGCADGVAIR